MNNKFKLIGIAVTVAIVFATVSCDDGSSTVYSNGGNVQIDPQYQGIWENENPSSSLVSVVVTDSTIIFTWSGNSYGYDSPFGPFTATTKFSNSYGNYHIYSNSSSRVLTSITFPSGSLHLEIKLSNEGNSRNFGYFERSGE